MPKKLLVLILAAAILFPSSVSAYKLEERWERSFSAGEGVRFVLANVNGDIEVNSWDDDGIRVDATIIVKAPSKSKAEEIYGKIEFLVDERKGRLSIEADLPRTRQVGFLFGDHISISVHYDVRVPRMTDLDLSSVNGGIEVDGVKGRFDVSTTNGSIGLRGVEGDGGLRTVNGGIKCHIAAFPEGGCLEVKTTNGGVRLDLPDDVGGSLEAKTVNGGIDLDLPLSKSVRIKRRSISGVLGDGEGRIIVRTTNGGISIE